MSTAHNLIDRTGERYGRLVVIEQAPSRNGYGMWRCRCDCGGERIVRGTQLSSGQTTSCGCRRLEILEKHAFHRDVIPNYEAMHKRVSRERGPAAEHVCVDCGEPALHWSYDGQDPAELTGPDVTRGRVYQVRYSASPEHYDPRCARCHKRFDTTEERAS